MEVDGLDRIRQRHAAEEQRDDVFEVVRSDHFRT